MLKAVFERNLSVALRGDVAVEQSERKLAVELAEAGNGREVDGGLPGVACSYRLGGVGLAEQHPRPALLHHGLGKVEELEEERVADGCAAVNFGAEGEELGAGHTDRLLELGG